MCTVQDLKKLEATIEKAVKRGNAKEIDRLMDLYDKQKAVLKARGESC